MPARAAALLMGVVLLGGCALTRDYERPDVSPPDAWRHEAAAGESIANLPWWELYEDEALRWLIRTSLERNRDLAIALSRMQQARHQVVFTMADQFPFVDAFAGAARGRPSQFVLPAGTGNQFSVGASVSFEVDLWRRFARATEGAKADLLSSEAAYRNVTISLVSSVASTYFLLRDLDARLAISQRTVAGRQDSLRIIGARFDRGTVGELDVNQAQIQLAIAEASVAAFERQIVEAENALRVLIGAWPGAIPRGGSLDAQALPPEVPAGLPSELLDRRPDVVGAEQRLAAETARIGVAEALRYPSITLTGSLSAVADELSEINTNEAKAWNIAANAFQPLFNAGQLRAQAQVQHERAEQAFHDYVATLQVAFREVEDSLVGVRTWREEHEARRRQAAAARNAARLSRARYDAGVVDYLEVLDTERTLFDSELAESATLRESLAATVRLYKALGGGWLPEPETEGEEADAEAAAVGS